MKWRITAAISEWRRCNEDENEWDWNKDRFGEFHFNFIVKLFDGLVLANEKICIYIICWRIWINEKHLYYFWILNLIYEYL